MSKTDYEQLARKVLAESLGVQKGDAVTIETWDNGLPFATKVVLEAKRIGASPLLLIEDGETFIKAAKTIPKENLGKMGSHEYALLSETDAYVFIPGPPLAPFSKSIDSEARSAATAYNLSWYEAAAKARLRGVRLSFGYVGEEMASLLRKDKNAILRHLVKASLCDYADVRKKAVRVSERLADGADAKITSNDHRLEFQFKGDLTVEDGVVDDEDLRKEDNVAYIPPGWVGKQVDSNSVDGTIELYAPSTRFGGIPDVQLKFKEGRLVEWNSRKKKENLNMLLNTIPEEKRTIALAHVGLNPVLRYGYSQDRFVAGAIGISVGVFGLSGIVPSGTLSIGGKEIVHKGTLV